MGPPGETGEEEQLRPRRPAHVIQPFPGHGCVKENYRKMKAFNEGWTEESGERSILLAPGFLPTSNYSEPI